MTGATKKGKVSQDKTVKIDNETDIKLNLFCKKQGITKKDFISLALDYFERTGVDIRSNEVAQDLNEIKDSINALVKLQADAAVKLTGIQQTTNVLTQQQESTTKMLEASTQKKRSWFGFGKK